MRENQFFGVVADPQSYINILYLLLAFPLGTVYFVFLVTGLSVGFGMIITLVGIPILLLVLGAAWAMCEFERRIAVVLLKEDIPSGSARPTADGLWARLKTHLSDRVTWTGILYLWLKFPLGVVTFTVAVTLIGLTLGMLTAPIWSWAPDPPTWGDYVWDPFPWSWIGTLVGIPLVFISLHLMNALATASGRLARGALAKP